MALADYHAVDGNEVTMREGDTLELIQVGHQGWWYVRHLVPPVTSSAVAMTQQQAAEGASL